jgi:chromosomal replication initiator protein
MPGNLRDVFAAGLAVNLDALDVPTRAKILCHMCREQEVTIPENTAVLVVRRLGANLHKLEGAATEIVSLTQFHGRPVTVEDLRVAQDNQGLVSCDQIVSAVADAYLVRPVDIKGSQRLKRMVAPRHLAMYLVRRGSQLSLPEIGRRFGGRDHTTVMHAIHRIEEKLLADAHFRLRALDIARRLGIDLEIGPLSS